MIEYVAENVQKKDAADLICKCDDTFRLAESVLDVVSTQVVCNEDKLLFPAKRFVLRLRVVAVVS